ncbi:MAG TPA: hypothetical protein VHR66_17395 [Gemmataceae bacterium]|jgi:hypothetical protein|nr:hypothetical protein [Gemmataceae bacterium]
MANVYQQAAKRRKLAYLAAIVVLLVCSLGVRGSFFRIDRKEVEQVKGDPLLALTLDGRAKIHELTELQQGEKELGGAAVQLLLTGSRGLAVCALWNTAIDKQKRQEWNELDIAVDSITKLQPHFTAPWLFQSWNLTYNVSVEMDRLNDMYFYIARGISVIAEGEALNRNNPDLRYNIGFYYQNKFGVSDRVTTLRCLYQLSCIPEEERDPERLLNPDRTVNQEKFEQFCRDHRELVRRLKEARIPLDGSDEKAQTLASSPSEVIAFLRANRRLPSRYKAGSTDLEERRLKQFPVFPDLRGQPITTRELSYDARFGDGEQDAFFAARAWYSLANCSLPPPNPVPNNDGSFNPDPLKYRIPKRPATIIFRQGPMRAQSYLAERLTKEGWFDPRDPWIVDDLLDEDRAWMPRTGPDGKRVSVEILPWEGSTAQEAWKEAAERWRIHGNNNGLRMDPTRLLTYLSKAEEYAHTKPGLFVGSMPPPMTPEEAKDAHLTDLYEAFKVMWAWYSNRTNTNYETFELESDAMQSDDAMLAKKRFRQADKAYRAPNYAEAVRLYDEGFAAWQRVMLARQDCRARKAADPSFNQQCRDFRDLDSPQESIYETNLKYVRLAQDVRQRQLRDSTMWLNDLLYHAGGSTSGNPFQFACDLNVLALDVERNQERPADPVRIESRVPQFKAITPLALPGPMDGNAPDGTPWISDDVKRRIRERLGLAKPAVPPANASLIPTGPGGDAARPPGR